MLALLSLEVNPISHQFTRLTLGTHFDGNFTVYRPSYNKKGHLICLGCFIVEKRMHYSGNLTFTQKSTIYPVQSC